MSEVLGGNAASQLRGFVDRLERLYASIDEIKEQIKEVLAEAKGMGFDVVPLRRVVRIRRMNQATRKERAAIISTYLHATGDADGPDDDGQCDLV